MPDPTNISTIETHSCGPVSQLPPKTDQSAPSPEDIATVALEAGRLLMQSGANAKSVQQIVENVGGSLGADSVEVHLGYASLGLNIIVGKSRITHMRKVGPVGVNHRLNEQKNCQRQLFFTLDRSWPLAYKSNTSVGCGDQIEPPSRAAPDLLWSDCRRGLWRVVQGRFPSLAMVCCQWRVGVDGAHDLREPGFEFGKRCVRRCPGS